MATPGRPVGSLGKPKKSMGIARFCGAKPQVPRGLQATAWGEVGKRETSASREGEVGSPPISRVLSTSATRESRRRAIIPLGAPLPKRSSSLPGDSASSVDVPLFGLAPDGVCRAGPVARTAVGSYPTFSPLPGARRRRRFIFCCPTGEAGIAPPGNPARTASTHGTTPADGTFRRFHLAVMAPGR